MELKQCILGYENDFFKKDFCENIENLKGRIDDEFIEFGKSGQIFDKTSIIEYLSSLDSDRNIKILNFKIRELKDDLLIATYMSNEIELGVKALRSSIWIKKNSDWKLYFHQGTEAKSSETFFENP